MVAMQLVLPGSTAPHTPHDTWSLEICLARRTYTCFQIFRMLAKTGSTLVNNRSPCLQNGCQLVLPGSTAPHTPHGAWPLELCVARRTCTCFQIFRMLAKTGSVLVNNRWPCLQNGGQLVLPDSTAPHTSHDTWPLELCVARRTYTCFQIFKMQAKTGSALFNNRSPGLQNGGQLVLPDSTAPHGTWPLELCVAS